MNIKLVLTSIISGVLLLTACSNDTNQSSASIAEVNDYEISEDAFISELKDRYGGQLLSEFVQIRLLQEEAETLNISDEEVQEEMDSLKANFGVESDEELLNLLQMQLPISSIDEVKEEYILPQLALQKLMTEGVEVTDEEIAEYFEENKDQLIEVEVRHILVEDLETAEEVRAKIDTGEDFAELAEEYSTDPGSNTNGGKYDYFKKGVMAEEFEKVAFEQEVGTVSEPVQTSHGYHIIETTGKKDTLEDKKEEVEALLMQQKSRPAEEVLQELFEEATIKINDPQFKDLF